MPQPSHRVLVLAFLSSLLAGPVAAQTLPAGWTQVREVQIHETAGTNLTDYQVPLDIDTATLIGAGSLNADGSDLRFTVACTADPSDDATFLPYWIDPSTMGSGATRVWVKVPAIPASGFTHVLMYYGNPGATAMSAFSVFSGPFSATDNLNYQNAGGVTNSQRGFRFTPNGPVFVTQLGKNEPTGSVRYITLFDFATQAKLEQIQVSGPAAQYSYVDLPVMLKLEQGRDYVLEMYQGGADGYYYGGTPQTSPPLTYRDMRYCNGCTQDTFPTNYLNAIHYGYPDMTVYWAAPRPASEVTVTIGTPCTATTTCNADCSPAACGDTIVNAANNEECDDGNADDTDACVAGCTNATCGDGFVHAGVEECDDQNNDDTDACITTCVNAICGDGFLRAGVEQCDDNNFDGGDLCTNACGPATCGDGYVHVGVEECDDGNADMLDGCFSSCLIGHCGDGIIWLGVEECEDGNTSNTDACKNDCTFAECGDGFVFAAFEDCDDGNTTAGDGCSSKCRIEVADDGGAPDGGGPDGGDVDTGNGDGAGDGDTEADPDAGVGDIDDPTDPTLGGGGGCAATSGSWAVMLGGVVVALVLSRRSRRR